MGLARSKYTSRDDVPTVDRRFRGGPAGVAAKSGALLGGGFKKGHKLRMLELALEANTGGNT